MSNSQLNAATERARAAGVLFREQKAPERLRAIAQAVGIALPADFVEFYSRYDGTEEMGVAEDRDLLSLAEISAAWEVLHEVWSEIDQVKDNGEAAAGIARVMWTDGWIPFVSDGGGNYSCLDLAPDTKAGGRIGQVISYWNSEPEHVVLSASFTDWLASVEWTPEDDA